MEDYSVMVFPTEISPLRNAAKGTLQSVINDVLCQWPAFERDEFYIAHLPYPKRSEEEFLVYHDSAGLIEMNIDTTSQEHNVVFALRFAYCNPVTIYEPFCAIVEWLMRRYALYCQMMRDLAPEQTGVSERIEGPEDVRTTLLPSIEYNRQFWQMYAQTVEEAILRPGEALARFVLPHCINSQSPADTPSNR